MRGAHLLAVAAAVAATATLAAADTPYITANTTAFDNLEWVSVKFGGISKSDAADAWIGVYSPATADTSACKALDYPATAPWTTNAPVKFIPLNTMNNKANETGSGVWNFELINMYQDVAFVLFTGGIDTPKAVAKSAALTPRSAPPLRGHLARVTEPTAMRVTWNSAAVSAPVVKWGPTSGSYPSSAAANSSTYTADDMCGEPAKSQGWFDPAYWHTALMTGLTPGARYYYVYGSTAEGWSAEASFAAPIAPNPNAPLNLLVFADMGMAELDGSTDHWANPEAYETTARMAARAATGEFGLALHVGDVSYATGNEAKWFLYDTRTTILGSIIPVNVGYGNHERDYPGSGVSSYYSTSYDSGGECGLPTATRYPVPAPPSGADAVDSGWYTLQQGPVTIIMLNSELSVDPGSAQYTFLEAALTAVDRSVTPWLFVAFHRPMYYGTTRDANFAQFEPLLKKAEVDLVLTGHVHYAQVFCAIYDSACVKPSKPGAYDAPKHVIIGNAGMDLSPITPTGGIIEYQASEFGYSTILIHSATALTMNFYADSDDALHYSFNITRTFPRT